ncbi:MULTISPECIES: glycosyltransferase family 25 protein [unclassified Herbaspirillum]|uniref:glycosyltransferase family 25 protein n=1 Tax=unclassified Herbaspirillum TaxID=2624150 RepID=UPI001151CAD9|nr:MULTISPECIES: glycosyltransferase family 25 protein [unclassified Herbaspirillum]MBB5391426.1 glycosyl transferase family 25 [Herbaspirillum sp. SJZ102]TQK12889.1 glycosyl transferase family 25 [Herbaspirillum sp. SJZ130]TQK14893.1 glycosyl transferase family 25 [Herbaspirillum sp. SJZ106]
MTFHKISIVVISLVESRDRRRYIAEQFSKIGREFRFFDAERFKEYPSAYDMVTRWKVHGNHLNLSEIGCHDSHYRIWEQLVQSSDETWCILEDDVELGEDFLATLDAIEQVPFPFGIMRLCDVGGEDSWVVATLSNGSVVKDHRKQPFGTQGYVIHRDAARILLNHARRIVYAIDDLLNRTWEHRVRTLSITPSVLVHRNDLMGTTIGREKAKRTLFQKLKREFYMGRDSMNRRIHAWYRRRKGRPNGGQNPSSQRNSG